TRFSRDWSSDVCSSDLLARLLRLSPADRRRLAICGIGAGFTAVFGTPLGGAIFAIEVLFGGAVLYDILFPSLVAGFTAYQVSQRSEERRVGQECRARWA